MQIVRTISWVLVLVIVALFTFANWDERATVNIWSDLVWDTRLPAVAIVSFVLGLIPMWLLHRGTKWRLNRRIQTLENAARSAALSRHNPKLAPSPAEPATTDDTLAPTDDKAS